MLEVMAHSAVAPLPAVPLSDCDAGDAVYHLLMRGSQRDSADGFDIHVVACILTLAFREAVDEQRPLSATTGHEPVELRRLVAAVGSTG